MLGLVFRWAPASPSQHVACHAPGGVCPGQQRPECPRCSGAALPSVPTDRWSLEGLGSSCTGLRMAARLFRLGRILCTPPRRAAANCDTCALGNSLSSMAPLRLLRCGLLAVAGIMMAQGTSALGSEGPGWEGKSALTSFLVLCLSVRPNCLVYFQDSLHSFARLPALPDTARTW